MDNLKVDDPSESAPGNEHTMYNRSIDNYLKTEVLPSESNYLGLDEIHSPGRPSIGHLHNAKMPRKSLAQVPKFPQPDAAVAEEQPEQKGKVIKFGWVQGVLMRCMLNIWGVMLFLRVSWMVGNCGLIQSLAVVVAGNIVTSLTALSMSAVATNGIIMGGGVYYMISRSLGPEFGGSIGLIFTVANSVAVATYITGFINSLQDMLHDYWLITMIDNGPNDIRAVGTAVLAALLILAFVGMDWVTRVQFALWILLIVSQIDIVVGIIMGPMGDVERLAKGFVGLNSETFNANVWADYRDHETVISVFAVFFTAVTGIVAGANLSGDLKNPTTAIPKGTLMAIGITFVSYLCYPFLLAGSVVRDANGDVEMMKHFLNSTGYKNGSLSILDAPNFVYNSSTPFKFGLENSFQVMETVAGWGPLIYMGCFAATLSSAIASLVGAPRILQALAKDELYPGIGPFKVGYGANNDPVRGYLLVCFITLICIMIADLNFVSTLLTNFFLASYALINFSCFHASLIKSPGWRPSFKYYNLWVSLFGGLLCCIIMFLIDYITALVTVLICFGLYLFVSYRKPDVNWGSSTQAQAYFFALKSSINLQDVDEHVKNYRPQVLVLCGAPEVRTPLIDIAQDMTKHDSLMICGHIVKHMSPNSKRDTIKYQLDWLKHNKIKAFYNLVEADNMLAGASGLFQLSGLGKMRPNIVMMGMKNDWKTCDRHDLKTYFDTLHEALHMRLSLCILRLNAGLDFGELDPNTIPTVSGTVDDREDLIPERKVSFVRRVSNIITAAPPRHETPHMFKEKQYGTIDVWWLYDDGGLTLLLPYLLNLRSTWKECKLRIFVLANRNDELDMEQRSMANLLAKFRIDYSDVFVIPGSMKPCHEKTKADFHKLVQNFISADNSHGCSVTEAELKGHAEKTNHHLRLREMVLEHSHDASLVVMTLPLPRKGQVSAPLYMAWLDFISHKMPPFMFVRGNQQSVLTFYS